MPNLDLVITGDCISAVTALSNTERAVGSLQSKAGSGVGVAVSVLGARAATKDLGSVSSAIGATHVAAAGLNRTPIAGGMVAGAAAARGLSSSLGGTSRAMREAQSGAAALAVVGASSTRSMGAMIPVMSGVTSRMGAMSRAGAAVAALPPPIPGGRGGVATMASATTAAGRMQSALAAQQLQQARGLPVMAMANAETRALAGNATAAAGAMTRLGNAAPIPVGSLGYLGNIREGLREGMLLGLEDSDKPVREPSRGLPPVVPPPPRGGGGGGGGGDADAERQGAAAAKTAGEIGKGIGTMLMAGMAVGIATNAAYAKHALDAVNVTISETPGLADKAKDAADELGSGIRDITEGVNMDAFADQFERLGTANRALGQMQGQIGMSNLAVKLETEAQAADAQTRALGRMAPAFDSAIRGASNLEIAVLDGISNPQVVNGVKALGESLAQPEIKKGLSDITTGATASALVFAKVAADIGGAASRIVNSVGGAQNVTDMSGAIFGGGAFAALAKGGVASKSAAGILGGSAIFGSQQLMEQGRDDVVVPSLLNMGLGALMTSAITKNPLAIAAGGLAGQWGTIKASQIPGDAGKMLPSMMTGAMGGFMLGGPWGAVGGAAAGGLLSGIAPGGPLAPPPAEALGYATGMHAYAEHLRTPQGLGAGGLLSWATAAGSDYIAETMSPGSTLGAQGPVAPGPQQPEAPKSQAEQLQERAKETRQRVAEQRRSQGLRPAGSGSAPPAAVASSVQQLDQSAQQATQSVQGLGQALPQVAQQAQQLPVAMRPVSQTVSTLPNNATQQMNQAASSISQSAQQVGQQIPPAISQGIVKQTPKVCDAAADMGNSAVNCTARAIQSASPSKKFIALGQSTGDGMAIGVNNSAGGAVDAVGSMATGMLEQVGAFGSGVQAASDGAVPIAEAGGLMVGYTWARSVATGVDSVIKSADFAQASMPSINSALAKSTLGKLGLLGIAGSGASISKTANGGVISMPPPVINLTVQAIVDGAGPMRVISQQVVDTSLNDLVDSISRQRG